MEIINSCIPDFNYCTKNEIYLSNKNGFVCNTSLNFCNYKRQHGLYVCPLYELDGGNHVMLSSLDETIVCSGNRYNLAIHQFPGRLSPEGDKYISRYETKPIPKIAYSVATFELTKELLISDNNNSLLIRYHLKEASVPIVLSLKPFLAFRNVKNLSVENNTASAHCQSVENGIKARLYNDYPYLYIQASKKQNYECGCNWYKNIEYGKDIGQYKNYREDLLVPGLLNFEIQKGEVVILSIGLEEIENTACLFAFFNIELKMRKELHKKKQLHKDISAQKSEITRVVEKKYAEL